MSAAIDVFCHWLPQPFVEVALERAGDRLHMLGRAAQLEVMVNLDARFAVMDRFAGYRQVPSLASPPIEFIDGPEKTPEIARLANDAQAAMVQAHPDRFAGFVAALPMNNPDAAVAEAERALGTLNAAGVQVFSNVLGRPLDEPPYLQVLERMGELGKPVWLHPARGMKQPDYLGEKVSKFDLWWALGWPHETSVAMGRLVFSGLFDRHPDLVIVAHHAGGTIPLLEGRLDSGLEMLGTRQPPGLEAAVATALQERPLDAFKRFYADTATFGSGAALACGLAFFGSERMLFASDMPFDPEQGPGYIRATLAALDNLDLPAGVREDILAGNARRVLGLQ